MSVFSALLFLAQVGSDYDGSDDFSPMLFMMALVALIVVFVLFVLAVVIAFIATICVVILTTLGVVSTATVVGLWQGKFSSAIRALHYQICVALTIPAALGILWLANTIIPLNISNLSLWLIATASGLIGGLLIAFVLDKIANALTEKIKTYRQQARLKVGS